MCSKRQASADWPAMKSTVSVKNGRLVLQVDGKLELDRGGDFRDAVTNGKVIAALKRGGRVELMDMHGSVLRDMALNASEIGFDDDARVVTTASGRKEVYVGGQRVLSTPVDTSSSSVAGAPTSIRPRLSASQRKSASSSAALTKDMEALGAAVANVLLAAGRKVARQAYKHLRERFSKRAK